MTISGREIVERLTRLEEGQKRLEQRIEEVESRLGKRIDELRAELGQRIEDVSAGLGRRIEEVSDGLGRRIEDVSAGLGQRIEEGDSRLEKRIDQVESRLGSRIDELRAFLLWGFGITFAGMFALIGFVIWDRRTALAPAVARIEELRAREERVEAALRDYAHRTPDFAESLKKTGLL